MWNTEIIQGRWTDWVLLLQAHFCSAFRHWRQDVGTQSGIEHRALSA